MAQQYHFQIAQHPFTLSVPAIIDITALLPSFRPFVYETEVTAPLFTLTFTDTLEPLAHATELTRFEWEGAECVITTASEGYEVTVFPAGTSRGWKMKMNPSFTKAEAELRAGDTHNTFIAQNFLMMLFAFASAPHSTLMFHASVIRCDGKGYLFLGKSGTGKSTHTRLWLQHIEGAELLNDDNPIIRLHDDGRVVVYGSPWSGKTPCYRNEEAPVGAFVRLQQAPHNRIEQDGTARAFASLLPSCSCLKQDENQYAHICNTITALATRIPVYKLECLPNRDAAEVCFQAINAY